MVVYFVTGASGVGKTSFVKELKKKHSDWEFHHFDSLGVPSTEEMVEQFGSIENWQRDTTYKWVEDIVKNHAQRLVVFEGQVNLDFIEQAFDKYEFTEYRIILVDCDTKTMKKRLSQRGQPELYTKDMENWLLFLHNQAVKKQAYILDNSKSLPDLVDDFEKLLEEK